MTDDKVNSQGNMFLEKLLAIPQALGRRCIESVNALGSLAIFMCVGIGRIFTNIRIFSRTFQQLYIIGWQSIFVISLIGIFCGMVLGLQGYYTLVQFGSTGLLGSAVSLSLIRELGPTLTALMLAGRAGSAMAAEIGVMRITDQVDALAVMDINPVSYLVSPRILASLISFPLLTAIFDCIGIFGGYLTGVVMLDMSEGIYFYKIAHAVTLNDVTGGFIKALVFGLLVSVICCHQGYFAHARKDGAGPEAVGNSTTSAVVMSSVAILAADYVITSFWL